MHRVFTLLLLIMSMLLPFQAHAQTEDPIFKLQQNQSLLHISATEQREVDQDLLIATLRFESENANNAYVQNAVNQAMALALENAKTFSNIKAVTRAYTVRSYDQNAGKKSMPRDTIWKAQQSIELKSKDTKAVLELAGLLQKFGFIMGGLNYVLSPERAAQIQDEMLESALEKLSARALRAAKALGKSQAELKEINTTGNYAPQPRMQYARMEMAQSMSVKMAAPVASPGETTISMTVSAKALLK